MLSAMNKYLIGGLTIIIIILLAGLGYFIFQNQKLAKRLASSPSPTVQPISSPQETPPTNSQPSPSAKLTFLEISENIKDGVNSRDFAALRTYMTDPITVILQATECCGPKTPDEAVSQMSYIKEGVPFNFNQNSDLVKNLKAKNPELDAKFIGVSQDKEHLIAFGLNSQNRISDIRMSVSWKLFNQ